MQERLWKSRCFKRKICSMTLALNIAVEQGVIVATIMIAFYIYTFLMSTNTRSIEA